MSRPRFTKNEIELFQKIANDISEGIDGGESRKTLRRAVDYYCSEAVSEWAENAQLKSRMEVYRQCVSMAYALVKEEKK